MSNFYSSWSSRFHPDRKFPRWCFCSRPEMLYGVQFCRNYRFCLGGSGHRPHRPHIRCAELTVSSPLRLTSLMTRLWPSRSLEGPSPAAMSRTTATEFLPRTQQQILCSVPFSRHQKSKHSGSGHLLGAGYAFRNLLIGPRSYLTPPLILGQEILDRIMI